LTTTDGHPFNTPEGWRDAILLKKGGKLLLKGDGESEKTVEIASVTHRTQIQTTYNLEVANAHTFFVGVDGVLVHNGVISSKCWTDVRGRKQVAVRYGSRREAKEAAENCGCGLWSNQPDPAHKPGERPHYHDRNHEDSSKPNVHYEY
jgi:hypothetical protein